MPSYGSAPSVASAWTERPIVNQRHLVRVLTDYEKHDNAHRPHRALTQLSPDAEVKSVVTATEPSSERSYLVD